MYSGTSLPIADLLAKRGVPFVFATDYGDQLQMPDHLDRTRIIQKPYTSDTVARVIGEVRALDNA